VSADLPIVALACGDPAGIGPELCMKAALSDAVTGISRPLIFGDPKVLAAHASSCGIEIDLDPYDAVGEVDWDKPGVKQIALDLFGNKDLKIGEINGDNGKAAVDCAAAAIRAALDKDVDAVVSAPQTETAVHMAGIEFDGYPSFVARQTGLAPEDGFLMVCFDKFRIAHCTLHSSVRQSLDLITEDRVKHVIGSVHDTLVRIGIDKPRIMVAGLNPHASEGGLFGSEEAEIIEPAIKAKQAEGIDVDGPGAADLILHMEGYDAFIVMLHDQGHIPAKLLARHSTAGMSIGTPILFSSVAHGSALDIAGQGKATPDAMIEAVKRLTGNANN
jgi:4-hydroxy-L-threonine phosphate dehydrogenase PdxA